jgi:2-oxo-4-hydroxy-4-carboxy--5-ureidoimidazoline (OHCU) decarboxylase
MADMLEQRLGAERAGEKQRALRDVIAIARDRAARLGSGLEVARR